MFRFVVTILLFFLFTAPCTVTAGDEVDYSAPYLVVENGELVTKYPALEHAGASPVADAQASLETESLPQQDGTGNNWAGVAAAIAVAIVLVLLVRRKQQQ